jgi:type IX secretion system PorP/SprF family membrane protein
MKNIYSQLLWIGILLISPIWAKAQSDFNLSQFQNTPLLTNPAMTAMDSYSKILSNYRTQPNATGENFTTGMLSGIFPLVNKEKNHRWGGFGLTLLTDNAGRFLKTNGGIAGFAYNFHLKKSGFVRNYLSIGAQGGYFQNRINLDGLTTSSQYVYGIFMPNENINEFIANNTQSFGVLSAGAMWYATDTLGANRAFLGISAVNVNTPKLEFYEVADNDLPHHFIVTGGLRILDKDNFYLMPNFRYIRRSTNNELIAGSWLNFKLNPFNPQNVVKKGYLGVGVWYNFNKAFVGGVQFDQPKYYVALNIDLPTSNNSFTWQGNSAFEITVGLKLHPRPKRIRWDLTPLNPVDMITTEAKDLKPQFAFLPYPFKSTPAKDKPKTKPGVEDGAFRFKFNSSELDEYSKQLLDSVSQVLEEFPETIIDVSGHTCDIGTDERNLVLSQKRAETVKKYLIEYDHIDPKRIITDGFGESRPLVPNSNEANRVKNRRVAFKIKFPE